MKDYSTQPRKQRLANYNRNQHSQMRSMSAHLSDELLKEYSLVRSVTVRKGDTVKVVRGIFKGHTAKVVKVFPQRGFITIDEATLTKADGKKVARMFRPSKVILTKLDLSDPWRREKLSRFKTPGRARAAEEEAAGKKEAAEKKDAAEEKQELKAAKEAEELAEDMDAEEQGEEGEAGEKEEEGAEEAAKEEATAVKKAAPRKEAPSEARKEQGKVEKMEEKRQDNNDEKAAEHPAHPKPVKEGRKEGSK